MPPQNLIYYPSITDIIKPDDLPDFLSYIKTGLEAVLSKVYYKDYYFSKNISGSEAFYSLSIVSKTKLALEVPGTGISLVLNPDFQDGDVSSFPITLFWHWEVLRFVKYFKANQFSFSVQDLFDLGLMIFDVSESSALRIATDLLIVPNTSQSNFQQLVEDINVLYGSNIIIDDYSSNKYQLLITQVNNLNQGVFPTIFGLYILSSSNISQAKQKLNLFYSAFVPDDFESFVRDLIIPKIRATLTLTAAIEFPANILKPVDANGVEIQNTKTKFLFATADFYADTETGVGYQMELAGSLVPTYASIGNSGLILQIVSLKVDLSKTSNILEADLDGRASDFMGVYARAISVTFPPKWFQDDNTQPGNTSTTLRLGGYDLLVGTGGVSGTIMLESVPIATPGTSFEYFNDKFNFNYPISIYVKDAGSEEVKEQVINNYQELKDILQQLNNGSNTPYPFKFPISLTPIGQANPIVFTNAAAYQAYLGSLNNNILWKRIGSQSGFKVGFKSFDITFKQNTVVSSNIAGSLFIPKFTDSSGNPAQIDVLGHIDANGDFLLTASAVPPFDPKITWPNVFTLHLKSVELGKEGDKFFIGASADVEFLGYLGTVLKGQTLSISTLRIYSDGHIDFRVNGGNLILPQPIKIPLGPVEVSVTAIHFGSHERVRKGVLRKYNYFGFDGGVSIGIAGVDARGDGINYYYTVDDDENAGKDHDAYLHIQTIHVDMVIPANSSDPSVAIKGWLSIPEPGEFQEYMGGVSLKVKNPRIAGGVDMRLAPKYPAFLLDANIELPNPIALGPVSLYGFRGLLGYRYVAEKEAIGMTSQNTWYQYYTAPQRGVNVRKFNRPDKTSHYSFPFSLGVGAIIGDTMAAGTIISANAMLLLSLPSMVMIDARMKLLSSRVKFTDDPPFFAFIIFGDNSLEFGFGADYKFPEDTGDIVKLYAEIQAGFFFNNQSAWYINFGTQQNPITAKVLKDLFTLKAYLMISGKGIQAGARGEFRFDRKFGPIGVFVLAYLELGGKISFKKPQMGAYLEAGLAIDVDVKIIRIYIAVTILLAVESPRPFLIYGAFIIEFKLKILFFKIKFKAKLELKWEFNKDVDRTPINPFADSLGGNSLMAKTISDEADGLVKGVSMLTNETFDLMRISPSAASSLDPATIHHVLPLDTYIDIKSTKGLLPTIATNSVIGGFNNPAANSTDLIPPDKVMKGLEFRQVKHQYTLETIELKAHNGSGWTDYDPFKAIEPSNLLLNNLKVGQWQKKDNQYNAIRILGMTPFSYTEQGNPGWFIPEQYGILPSTLFCVSQTIENSVSDFLEKPLHTLYYASSSNFFHSKGASYQISGDVQYTVNADGSISMTGDSAEVTNESNIHGFLKSLQFPNHSTLTIMLPAPSVNIELKLSTFSTGVTISFYNPIIDDNSSSIVYELYYQEYVGKDNLNAPFILDGIPVQKGITKIILKPDFTGVASINLILTQMAVLMNEGYQIALQQGGGIVSDVQPSNPSLYHELEQELNKLQLIGCEGVSKNKYEEACYLYPQLLSIYNNNFNKPFRLGIYSTDEELEFYVEFIQNNFSEYENALNILNSSNIPESIYEYNREHYTRLLERLNESISAGNPNQIVIEFENLKIKLQQILNQLKDWNMCSDQNLCNLSDYLKFQEFYDQNNNFSPLLNELNQYISNNSQYYYLTDYLVRQINTITLIINSSTYFENTLSYTKACQEIVEIILNLGNCSSEKKCFTMFHEVKWISVEDYEYNINIPGQAAITSDTQAAVDALTKSIQPIWRPDTAYFIKFKLKDNVDNGQNHKFYEYAYAFRTGGPLGFFHLDKDATYGEIPVENSSNVLEDTIGVIRDANWNIIDDELTPHPDLYPHTSLRAYIDYQRSYPNADGNIVNAKPLFYDDITTKISLYFTSSYVSKLLDGWDPYNGMDKLGGTMKIIIKDPVEGIEIINPPRLDATQQTIETSAVDIPQTIEDWAQDNNPAIPSVLNQYFNMLNSGANCTGIITLVKPKSFYRIITPKRLKPQKLYTAQVLNFYWGKNQVDVSQITTDIKEKYAKEVHKFVFQTSRYKDFRDQIFSFYIPYVNENGENKTKQAIFTIANVIDSERVKAAFDTILGTSNAMSEAISLQYQHPFDRIMQGLFGISPLEDAISTEINKIVDKKTGSIVALLIRNPEPFNHPKIPLNVINRNGINAGMIEIMGSKGFDTSYQMLYSKDYAQAIIMRNDKWNVDQPFIFSFQYKIWDGTSYIKSSEVVLKDISLK